MDTKKKKQAEEEVAPLPATAWDNLVEDWRANPKRWVTRLIAAAVILGASLVGWTQWSSSQDDDQSRFLEDMGKAETDQDGPSSVDRMEGLEETALATGNGTLYFVSLARICIRAADNAETQDEKIVYYKKTLAVIQQFKEKFPESPLLKLSWKPNPPGTPTKPTVVAGLAEYAQKQIDFLTTHPYARTEEFDPNLNASMELEDSDGKRHTLKMRFFSKLAPYSVDTVCRLAKEGWFTGTLVYGLEREQLGNPGEEGAIDELVGFHLGSGMTKASAEDSSLWGDLNKDRVGFSVPFETNHLKPLRGRVALEFLGDIQSSSPVRLVIYARDSSTTDESSPLSSSPQTRTILGEIEGGEDAFDSLLNQETEEGVPVILNRLSRLSRLKKAWKVVSMTVEGEAQHQPDKPILSKPRLPEPPEKKEEDTPKDGADDKKPGDAPTPKKTPPPGDGKPADGAKKPGEPAKTTTPTSKKSGDK